MSQKYSYQTNQQKYNFILKVYNRIMFLLRIFFSPKYTMKTLLYKYTTNHFYVFSALYICEGIVFPC